MNGDGVGSTFPDERAVERYRKVRARAKRGSTADERAAAERILGDMDERYPGVAMLADAAEAAERAKTAQAAAPRPASGFTGTPPVLDPAVVEMFTGAIGAGVKAMRDAARKMQAESALRDHVREAANIRSKVKPDGSVVLRVELSPRDVQKLLQARESATGKPDADALGTVANQLGIEVADEFLALVVEEDL